MTLDPAWTQGDYSVRFDWGLPGALACAPGADVVVVVDVLSFTTTVTIGLERGIAVYPAPWNDDRVHTWATELDAVLAEKRGVGGSLDAPAGPKVSLSPASMMSVRGVERVVLPSPNGATICRTLADAGHTVIAASLRNAPTIAAWLGVLLTDGATVTVVAAGEQWPTGTMRPSLEDLWGAGAVLVPLVNKLGDQISPEALAAAHAYREVAPALTAQLEACASGRELIARGFADDIALAAAYDASTVVPLLRADGSFGTR